MRTQAEANLAALIESTEDLIWSVDLDYRLMTFNRALRENIEKNFRIQIAAGMTPQEFLPPERAKLWPPLYERALKDGAFRTEYLLADGRTLEMAFSLIEVAGKVTGISVFGKDITERKATEHRLQEAGEKYRAIYEGALEGMFQTTQEGRVLTVNPAMARMLGYDSPQDFISSVQNLAFDVWVYPEERAPYLALLKTRGVMRGFECQFKRKNGSTLWVSLSTRTTCTADGQTLINEGFIEDISERKRVELALTSSEKMFRAIAETSPMAICISTGIEQRAEYYNPAFFSFFGYTLDEVPSVAEWWPRAYPDADYRNWVEAEWRGKVERAIATQSSIESMEVVVTCKDGSKKNILWGFVSLGDRNLAFGFDLTERKRAEEQLRESQEQLRLFIENAPAALAMFDAKMNYLSVSCRWKTEYGLGDRDIRGLSHYDVFPEIPERWKVAHRRGLAGEVIQMEADQFERADGSVQLLRWEIRPWRFADGSVGGIVIFTEDITERKRAVEALRESSDFLKEAQRIGNMGCYVLDIASGTWTSTSLLNEIFGIDESYERSVAGWEALAHPDDQVMMASYFANEVIGQRKPFDKQYRIIRQTDGAVRWVHGLGKLEFDAQGRPTKMRGIISDVTAHKQWEMQLQESEARYRATFEQGAIGINHVSFEGVYLRCNACFAEIIGYPIEEIPGMSVFQVTLPEDRERTSKAFEQLSESSTGTVHWEKRFLRKDGGVAWAKMTTSVQRDGNGKALYRLAFVEDITERKWAEMQLQESEERYRTTFEQAAVGIVHSALDGRFLHCNARFAEIIGYPQEEIPGLSFQQTTAPEDLESCETAHQQLLCGAVETYSIEKRFVRKDGSRVWGNVTISSQRDGAGHIQYFIAIVEDIQARKETEERLAAAQEAMRVSEERYKTVFETCPDAVMIIRMSDGVVLDCNRAFLDSTCFDRNEVIGRKGSELGIWVNDSDLQILIDLLQHNSRCRDMEVLKRRKNGEIYWVRLSASLMEIGGESCRVTFAKEITEIKAAEERTATAQEAMRASEARYRTAFQTSIDAFAITRLEDGMFVDVNDNYVQVMGYTREELVGQPVEVPNTLVNLDGAIHRDIFLDLARRDTLGLNIWVDSDERQRWADLLRRDKVCRNFEARFRRKNGQIFWALMSASITKVDGVACVLAVIRDISEAKEAEEKMTAAAEALRLSEMRYRTAFQTSIDAININRLDNGKYVDCNQAFLDILGYQREEVIGRTSLELGVWVDHRDRKTMAEMVSQSSSCRSMEVQFRKKNGELMWGELSASLMDVDGVPCVLSITRDLSSSKAAENEIRNLAFYDPLTGLPNRRLLLERLQQVQAIEARNCGWQALLLLDLDNFKTLNDTLGHQPGDLLLQQVAQRIISCVPEAVMVGRLGSDEFVVILDDLSEADEEAATQAEVIGEKMLASINEPYLLLDRECLSTASIGITFFGGQRNSTDEILQQADIALHQAKAAGGNMMRFFSPALQAAVNARAQLEDDLRRAIKTDQFRLYYQPQVERGHITGAEALIRWQHPLRGMVQPNEFIPLAEESRLILPIGEWVLETACTQLALWAQRQQTNHLTVAVNISAVQFRQPEFVATVLKALERSGANPKNLKLELTESTLVDNIDDVIAKMTELKSHGLSFSLDDFGTGYSSLAYLKRLPLDQLKIDRVFVRDMLIDVTSGAIAQAVISLGRAMDLSVMAEGVETEEQRGFLTGLGCHAFQGFLFSPPLSLEEFEAFL
jgi:diguanylate cyclase (GGDEF)-like protein/PAS domain S-box-containing protein